MTVPERYIVLGHRLGKHVDGFVDSYYGPPELREQVEGEEATAPRALAEEAAELIELVGTGTPRERWLRAQLVGLETVARRLAGDDIGWIEEVELCHGVTPVLTPESEFEEAHRVLVAAVGDQEGFQRWQDANTVPAELVVRASEVLAERGRERTRELFGLPEGEEAAIEVVTDVPWAAYNYYLGDLRSRVVVSGDLPIRSHFLAELVPHELYPGHHTEHAWKEELLVRGRGIVEESIVLTGTPQSLVSEGIAMLGESILFPDLHREAAELLKPLGVPYDPEVAEALDETDLALRKVGDNMAYLLNVEGRPVEEVIEYGVEYRWVARERIEKSVEFLIDPTWRAYAACYTNGYLVCDAWVGGDPARFKRLLTEQLTPADLLAG